MSTLFIGVDAGGTATRAVLATADGSVIGVGEAAGANSWSSGTSVADVVSEAVAAAVSGHDPGLVAGGIIGIAGGGAGSPRIAAELVAGWQGLSLPGKPEIVSDVLVAFASGTSAPYGLVVTAGTGSVAARISERRIDVQAGGHGYLVGDEGSAVWLGIGAVRAALRALDGRGPQTALLPMVIDALEISGDTPGAQAGAIVTATYSRPPALLGALAPRVVEVAGGGDGIAASLVTAAADELIAIALAAAGDHAPSVVVLGGSLLTRVEAINEPMRARLLERWSHATISSAASGAAGAAALAIGRHDPAAFGEHTRRRLHEPPR